MQSSNDSPSKSLRLSKLDEALDCFGTNLLNYAHNLCRNNTVDADALFDDLFLFALKKFPEDKLTVYGYYRLKLYQLFIDRWRADKRRPVQTVGDLPEVATVKHQEPVSDADEAALKASFFKNYPADITELQKDALFLWARYGFTHEEIGEKLGIPRSTVADQVKIARGAIVDYINNDTFKSR